MGRGINTMWTHWQWSLSVGQGKGGRGPGDGIRRCSEDQWSFNSNNGVRRAKSLGPTRWSTVILWDPPAAEDAPADGVETTWRLATSTETKTTRPVERSAMEGSLQQKKPTTSGQISSNEATAGSERFSSRDSIAKTATHNLFSKGKKTSRMWQHTPDIAPSRHGQQLDNESSGGEHVKQRKQRGQWRPSYCKVA